jgi:drug/metabolite transporter (DMT)-like permease
MTTQRGTQLEWILFVILGFFWGSSYLFIKIGVDAGLTPFTLVMLRLFFGLALLATVVRIAREPLPREARMYGHLIVMAAFNIVIPFSLITWAEQTVDSALAATLNSAVPLFVIVIAAIFLRDERITLNRLAGLLVGFVGVAILVGFDPATLTSGNFGGEIALIGATISYAIGAVYARRNIRGLRPMIPALFQVGFAFAIAAVLAFVFERPMTVFGAMTPTSLFAVVWLGLLGSGLAYLVFFRILAVWGATRTSMVAYLLPVYGIALGALVLHENVDQRLLVGTLLVIGGVALVNSRYGARPLFQRGPTTADAASNAEPTVNAEPAKPR